MMESLFRACVCAAVALLAADLCAQAVGLADDCARHSNCLDCRDSSATCSWCSTTGSTGSRCVSLMAPLLPGSSCSSCSEQSRTAREVGKCDDSTCLGVDDKLCSDHGSCDCGTCTCEPGYSGRACQNCPFKWDDCPGGGGGCCDNLRQCFGWQSMCAFCMREEGNATLCDQCPLDTQLVSSDPDHPQSAECVFDSLSYSSDRHCSYHVYYWRDEEPALTSHARVQLVCGSAADKTIFPKRMDESAEAASVDPAHALATAATKSSVIAVPVPSRTPPEKPPQKKKKVVKLVEGTERPEGEVKSQSAAATVFRQAAVVLCSLWTLWTLK